MNDYYVKIKSFTNLIVWQQTHLLVLSIYKITQNFPKNEFFSLTDQIKRATVSITSNIAVLLFILRIINRITNTKSTPNYKRC